MERRWPADRFGGDSAGGNLAVSAITSSAPNLRSPVRGAVLFYGAYDLAATAERNRSLPGLQEQLQTYVSGNADLFDDPRVSPLRAVAPRPRVGKLYACSAGRGFLGRMVGAVGIEPTTSPV